MGTTHSTPSAAADGRSELFGDPKPSSALTRARSFPSGQSLGGGSTGTMSRGNSMTALAEMKLQRERNPFIGLFEIIGKSSRQFASFLFRPLDLLLKTNAQLRDPLVFEPSTEHVNTVIMLHGMYCEADMYEQLPRIMEELGGRGSGTRFIFPTAPLRTIDWPEGTEHNVSAWYNYFTSNGGTMKQDDTDEVHLAQVTRSIHALIDDEVFELGGDAKRIVIGGNSQGGTVALHAALSYPLPLGAVLCGCTMLLDLTPLPGMQPTTIPILIFTAEKDQEYIPPLQRRSFNRLRSVGFSVGSHVEPGLDHYTTSIAELHHMAAWISGTLNGKPLGVTYRDVPGAKGPLPSLFDLQFNVD